MQEEKTAAPAPPKPYKAFISYSHAADDLLAPALQSALQSFAKPWYRLRAVRVFRDRTNLGVRPDLWGSIEQAVRGSEFFLLLASPEAARSPWVPREVEAFLSVNTSDRLLIVLTGGTLAWDDAAKDFVHDERSAFPRLGRSVFDRVPKWEDLSRAKGEGHISLRNPAFRDVVASISSTIRDIPLDEITGRDVIEHKKTKRIVRLVAAALVFLLACVAAAALVAYRQAGVANARRIAAEAALLSSREPRLLGVSALLAAEALKRLPSRSPSIEAQETLAAALQLLPRAVGVVGHRGPVRAVAFTPDGKRLVTGGDDGRVLVSEAEGGGLVAELDLGSPLQGLSVTSDGHSVAAITSAGEVTVWRWQDAGAEPLKFRPEPPITAYAFSRDGRFLAAAAGLAGGENVVNVYDLGGGERVASLPFDTDSYVLSLAFSGGGEYLAAGLESGGLSLWSGWATKTPREKLSLKTDGGVTKIVFDGGARRVACATTQDTLYVWNVADGKEAATASVDFVLNDIAYDAGGSYIAGASSDETARVWPAPGGDGSRTAQLRPQAQFVNGGSVLAVAFCPEFDERFERYLATAGDDGTARLWDYSVGATHAQSRERVRMPHGGPVEAIAFSPDGRLIATASNDGTARVWDFRSTPSLMQFRHSRSSRQYVTFLERRDALVTAGQEGLLYSWEPDGGRIGEWDFRADDPRSGTTGEMALSPGGARLAVAINLPSMVKDDESDVAVLDTYARKVVARHRLPGGVREMAFGYGGRYLAASVGRGVGDAAVSVAVVQSDSPGDVKVIGPMGGGDAVAVSADGAYVARFTKWYESGERTLGDGGSSALVWDVRTGGLVLNLKTDAPVRAFAFSLDGRRAAVGVGNAVELRELPSGRVLASMQHRGDVYALAFSAGGEYLASTGADATLRVWSVPDGAELSRTQMPWPAWQLAFSTRSGKYLATFAERGGAHVWLWRPDDLLDAAAARLPANLSREEWRRYVGDEPYMKTFDGLPVPEK